VDLHYDQQSSSGYHGSFNHAVLYGSDQTGRQYVYDPFPKTNQPQLIYADEKPQAYETYAGGGLGVSLPGGQEMARYNGRLNPR
jgi:hypothetical protein